MGFRSLVCFTVRCLTLLLVIEPCFADWPMWRYDAGRSAASPEPLPEELSLQWIRRYGPREQTWDDPLNNDLMQFDKVFEPIVAGGRAYLGFNDSGKVVALDLKSGAELWKFYTDGPVRMPPVAWRDKLFVCGDDGYLYCLRQSDGGVEWKFRGGPSSRKVLGNKRVISMWPARGGPVVRDGYVYFSASIWPMMGTFIYALDAETGDVHWVNDGTSADYIKQPHSAPSFAGVAPQGALAATSDYLVVPGGRSVPAVFDRHSGALVHFHLNAGGKGTGGALVLADDQDFYVHTRHRGTRKFDLKTGTKTAVQINEPVLAGDAIYTSTAESLQSIAYVMESPPADDAEGAAERLKNLIRGGSQKRERAVEKVEVRWELPVDGGHDLIKAGDRLYAAGAEGITAIDLPTEDQPTPRIAWRIRRDEDIRRLVAANGVLLAVTLDGQILAFGAGPAVGVAQHPPTRPAPPSPSAPMQSWLREANVDQGYALWFGVDEPKLLDQVLASSQLHIVAVEADADQLLALRERYDAMGMLGTRVSVQRGDPLTFQAPPYIAHLVVAGSSKYRTSEHLRAMYGSVRPYGGMLWLPSERSVKPAWENLAGEQSLANAQVHGTDLGVCFTREGPLAGAAPWTHLYGDVANTVKSNDTRVKPPLGILWFGGNSNMDVLPRHGHGPPEQVIGGRLFIEGVNTLGARDVYTGRVLWQRQFPDLGTFEVFYDPTYKNTPLDPSYNQVHIPGANQRGTNFVATEDEVYLVIGNECHVLDARGGQTIRVMSLPADADGTRPEQWTYIGLRDDLLLAGVNFGNYTKRLDVAFTPSRRRGEAWNSDRFGSLGLVALDRHSGDVRWRVKARHSFLHNGIVAGGGQVYLLDKLPATVEGQLARRGQARPDTYRLLAVDATSGDIVWESNDVFGTWLSYAQEHDILVQAGAAAPDRAIDEVGQGVMALRGVDGGVVWKNAEMKYAGPCIIYHDRLITNSRSYGETAGVLNLLDGSPVTIDNPLTGAEESWGYTRAYGCNTAVASEHLLTFRSGAAGFYDLNAKCGVGNLGGFRSGCSSNLIVADGVLNAPDYTRTCSCGYQNQTSLALVHMPDVETWYASPFDVTDGVWIPYLGLNFGAPGDRRAGDGRLWLAYPPATLEQSPVEVELSDGQPTYYRRHSSAASEDSLAWVTASGVRGAGRLRVRLLPGGENADGAPQGSAPPSPRYTVRLHFTVDPGKANQASDCEVEVQGESVSQSLSKPDVTRGRLARLVREIHGVIADDGAIEIRFGVGKVNDANGSPHLAGLEFIAE